MINWKVRIRNKTFWLTIIPALLLLAKQVLVIFGINIEYGQIQEQILNLVETLFLVLAILGIVVDPTTAGGADSERAMQYPYPKED